MEDTISMSEDLEILRPKLCLRSFTSLTRLRLFLMDSRNTLLVDAKANSLVL